VPSRGEHNAEHNAEQLVALPSLGIIGAENVSHIPTSNIMYFVPRTHRPMPSMQNAMLSSSLLAPKLVSKAAPRPMK
jgi:hypothetical protein